MGVETLFGRIPFEQHFSSAGASLNVVNHTFLVQIVGSKILLVLHLLFFAKMQSLPILSMSGDVCKKDK